MLSQLYINNIAVISEATIDLKPGLNVFTGETGAGKTILINAINAVLGERASKDSIRTGESKAVISALFEDISSEAAAALEQAGYPAEDGSVLITRELDISGKSTCKIDGRPATTGILKNISGHLINVHGQHDNQQLLSAQKHLGFIDSFGGLEQEVAQYKEVYQKYVSVKEKLENITTDEAQKAHRIDLLGYQINEIEAAQLVQGEEEQLKARRKMVKNSLNITQALGTCMALFEGEMEGGGLQEMFGSLVENISQAASYMEEAQPIAQRIEEISYEMEGFERDIRGLLEDFDCDPSELDAIERRLDTIYTLKKKYGSDIQEILNYRDNAWEELRSIENSDQQIKELEKQEQELFSLAREKALHLSERRKQASQQFVFAVGEELAFLDMPSVQLSVMTKEKPLSADGMDDLELMIVTNVGEQAKSLAKIASGGELSRIMLSIKNVLADKDEIQTMIFDEVDTGVSGRAAQKIGKKLAQVAQNRQVICVTHLAQVASFGNNHLYISKESRNDRTYTTIVPLTREQRIRELARISAGENITPIALSHGEEMLKEAGN